MSRLHPILRAAIGIALFTAAPAEAVPPQVMTYSGYLKTSGGAAVTSPTSITFRLYTTSSGGPSVWSEMVSVTPTGDGWFSAVIGTTSPLPFGVLSQDLYLSLQVGADTEFTQRARVTPSHAALTVDWGGVQGKPACSAGAYLTLDAMSGGLLCTLPATGAGGGLSTVSGTNPVTATTSGSSVSVGLVQCGPGPKILQWDGLTWACATPGGGFTAPLCGSSGMFMRWNGTAWECGNPGTVTAVAAAAPLVVGGTATAPQIALPTCTAGSILRSTGTSWECASPSLAGHSNSVGVVLGASGAHTSFYGATVTPPWPGVCTFTSRLLVLSVPAFTDYIQTSPAHRSGGVDSSSNFVTPLERYTGLGAGYAVDSYAVTVSAGITYDLGCHILNTATTAGLTASCKVTYHCTPT